MYDDKELENSWHGFLFLPLTYYPWQIRKVKNDFVLLFD
ncbi:MAG: hypothetical protein MRERV_7c056 [Mycoplasmataceae bacterium RV_VA103A]|nr:MAG: hypothetical protein MRERV_7c056 [Mycoplasmataceae bacterium RV_VA103A]